MKALMHADVPATKYLKTQGGTLQGRPYRPCPSETLTDTRHARYQRAALSRYYRGREEARSAERARVWPASDPLRHRSRLMRMTPAYGGSEARSTARSGASWTAAGS